jgi:hypothetical protein
MLQTEDCRCGEPPTGQAPFQQRRPFHLQRPVAPQSDPDHAYDTQHISSRYACFHDTHPPAVSAQPRVLQRHQQAERGRVLPIQVDRGGADGLPGAAQQRAQVALLHLRAGAEFYFVSFYRRITLPAGRPKYIFNQSAAAKTFLSEVRVLNIFAFWRHFSLF